jgi:CarboxypepD_reg-like domain
MSSTKKYNTTYSAADIEKYLRGELSPREMHDLENAALEDPFLADALDGISMLPSGPGSDLDELHTRLNARVTAGQGRNNIRRAIPRWSIAASVILLLGIGCAVYYTFLTNGRSKIVVSSSPSVTSSSPPAQSAASPKQAMPPASAAPPEPPLLARSKTPAPAPEHIEDYKVRHEAPPSVVTSDKADAAADTLAAAPLRQLEGRVAGVTLDSPARISMANALFKQEANSLVFSGRVLDNHDNPVPGASLTLGYRNTGTVTDQQGQFKLYLPPQDSGRYLTVAMIGYGQKSFPLNTLTTDNITDHVIHLQPSNAALEEVVVSGFGSKRKETLAAVPSISDESLDSLWLKARPVIGRNAYLHYLDTAQKSLALDSTITGTETVSFEVDKQGTLTSFKIEQSLSPAHDAAIIRLVKEGPAWQLLKQKTVRATVSVHF